MSSIEERLMRDIAAVAEGVVVTESDLQDARHEVLERIDTLRQRNLRRILATAVAAVVVGAVGVTAFQSMRADERTAPPANEPTTSADPHEDFLTGSAPSPALLAGVWRVDNGSSLLRFTTDGTVAFSSDGKLYDGAAEATYTIEGDLITVDALSGPADCDAPGQLAMRASQPEDGKLHIVHTVPVAGTCVSDRSERWVLEQILPPNNEGMAALDFWGDPFRPLDDQSDLRGDWMAQGGGHVLELSSMSDEAAPTSGTYYIAAGTGDVADFGAWSLDASRSKLRLVSASESPTCEAGDRFVLGDLTHSPGSPTSAFRGTVEQNRCGGAWSPEMWILLPHEGS